MSDDVSSSSISDSAGSELKEDDSHPWIKWHVALPGNEFLCAIDRPFIEDNFNLFGLRCSVEDYNECLDIILDRHKVYSHLVSSSSSSIDSPIDDLSFNVTGGVLSSSTCSTGSAARCPPTPRLAKQCVILYGLIHARYILTCHGFDAMKAKYENAVFGTCPNVSCEVNGTPQNVIPCGSTDFLCLDSTKVFCPRW